CFVQLRIAKVNTEDTDNSSAPTAEYLESTRRLKFNAYAQGRKIKTPMDHPLIRPSLNAVALTYEPGPRSRTCRTS
ncbi:MAG: hypothetical protein MZV70_12690, partial [Desulfobacterales bacterium]|nr:hypothetical protein [Desulfobacterales bacterium]